MATAAEPQTGERREAEEAAKAQAEGTSVGWDARAKSDRTACGLTGDATHSRKE